MNRPLAVLTPAIVAAIVVMFALVKRDLHALDVRIAKAEAAVARWQMQVENVPMSEAQRASLQRWDRLQTAAEEQLDDAEKRCRAMGQIPITVDPKHGWNKVVCLQAPSVAFELQPEWPQ